MKIFKINILVIVVLGFLAVSCSEERPIESDITFYPTFELAGGPYVLVEKGTSYEDVVTAMEGDTEIEVVTTGSVDTNVEGLYVLNYSATNSDGFDGTALRYVIVTDQIENVRNNDLSGKYEPGNDNDGTQTITKIADGFYNCPDVFPSNGISAIFGQVNDSVLVIPVQPSPYGDVSADKYNDPDAGGLIIDDVTIGWDLRVAGYPIFDGIELTKQ
ncbi:immunoglobulin-like domain-containing protein [Sinomicrobium weinanense]|uniref:DUF5011 domain-containing protein n=1 Tax=Sinomicrobium weinanense TaxID=2842200 RepID=A0A926JT43_9FLAO|nr:immunoglobulin-like domain-containing protein [Sinomicrobium weinanense]MBC9796829.1 DUF5011 domain-containing protein [Sinomicrobium weinanense]MBU3123667.1 DUF5011 domain-containing protein [Sinomicrobium weinanense]